MTNRQKAEKIARALAKEGLIPDEKITIVAVFTSLTLADIEREEDKLEK
jgi:hypothetical protein